MSATGRIAVCVATFRRPSLLAELLSSLRAQRRPAGFEIELRIVDNDADGSARAVVEQFSDLRPRYAIEPERSIARARNRALELGPADLVAFVDDDETARPDWLCLLHAALERSGADAVFGPVCARLPADAPRWAARCGLFDKWPSRRGTDRGELDWTATRTSNALVRGDWLFAEAFRFDPAYGRSGGEDTDLFRRLQAAGARFAPAPDAFVDETVHAEQCRLGWFVRRHFRGGINYERQCAAPGTVVVARFVKRVLAGSLRVLAGAPSWCCGRPETAHRGILELSRGVGGLVGWLRPAWANGGPGYRSSGTRLIEEAGPCEEAAP